MFDPNTPVIVRLSKSPRVVPAKPQQYDKIPSVFKGYDDWPKTTKLCCWHCGLQFDTVPRFIPIKMNVQNNEISFYTDGNFCSFSAVYSYIAEKYKQDPIIQKMYIKYLHILYYITFGKNKAMFLCAPSPHQLLSRYGGTITDGEYLKMCIAYDMCTSITDVSSDPSIKKYVCEYEAESKKPIKRTSMSDCAHLFAIKTSLIDVSDNEWSISVHK